MTYTASQIVQEACAIAKVPGYLAQGGRNLNLTLHDLVMHRNLKVNLVPTTITFAAATNGPFNLETDYARTYDLFYYVDSTPYFLEPASLREYDQEPVPLGINNYPYEFATDLSGVPTVGYGLLYIYPQFSTQTTCTHRYFKLRPEITSPETSSAIPWFEDQDYLIHATATRLMRITDDDRYLAWQQEGEVLLRKHLLMEGDEQQVVKEVKLDPRRFKVSGGNRPTKSDPF